MTQTSRVHHEIGAFLARILRPGEIVIGLLRYGAHLPHVAQRTSELPVAEIPMILSHLLEFFPASFFEGKDFLILDDSVYRGASMAKAFARLRACGVPPERIRTAAVVTHAQCEPRLLPNEFEAQLRDSDYIEWKEELTEAVRSEVRPTERDHPLYYFTGSDLAPTILMATGEELGLVHSIEAPSDDMLKFTVSFDQQTLTDISIPGIRFPAACKIRFYCERDKSGEWHITTVPIVPTLIEVAAVLKNGGEAALKLGLPETFFEDTLQTAIVGDAHGLAYFFLNRGLAALLLERFLSHVAEEFKDPTRLVPSPPELRDGKVRYLFPPAYSGVFHPCVYQRLKEALEVDIDGDTVRSLGQLRRIESVPISTAPPKLLSQYSEVLAPLVLKGDPVRWIENSWEPVIDKMPQITYAELMQEFNDQPFLSAALDELLDDGLLRATDLCLDRASGTYGRAFLPGGEYRALEVYRLGRPSGTEEFPSEADILMEDEDTLD